MWILHCCVSLPICSTVLQQHKLCRFTATLFNWNSYAEGVVGSTVRSSLVSGRPLGWVVALFWWNFFLNDLNCQKQKRSDICRWTLPDTFFIEHQYVMAKPDLKVGLLTQIMSCIGINLHIVICISWWKDQQLACLIPVYLSYHAHVSGVYG